MTYETPTVQEVGKASSVILGIIAIGSDLDGYIAIDQFQFAEDEAVE